MWKFDHRELSDAEQQAHDCRIPLAGAKKNESRNDNVPHSWETVKPDVFGLLICASEPQCTGDQDESRNCHGQAGLYDVHSN
jgi:hypothetical protein